MKISITTTEMGTIIGMNKKLYTKKQIINAIYNLQLTAEESRSGIEINIVDENNIEIDIPFSKVYSLITMPTATGDTLYAAMTDVFNDWYLTMIHK